MAGSTATAMLQAAELSAIPVAVAAAADATLFVDRTVDPAGMSQAKAE